MRRAREHNAPRGRGRPLRCAAVLPGAVRVSDNPNTLIMRIRFPASTARLGGIHPMLLVLLVLVATVVIAGVWLAGIQNGAVERDEAVTAAWADVDAQLQRRFDLIPNLVATVKGAANFEQETLTAITEARASVGQIKLELKDGSLLDDPALQQRFMAAQSQLGSALGRLMAVSESYPELRATQSFTDLQHQLEGTENRVTQARKDYNHAVESLNAFVRKVPNKWLLDAEEFPRRPVFEAVAAATGDAPVVDFGPGG